MAEGLYELLGVPRRSAGEAQKWPGGARKSREKPGGAGRNSHDERGGTGSSTCGAQEEPGEDGRSAGAAIENNTET